ncbi:hypothetical protein [Rothia sp. P5766]|uniref:hypothetical protein n=1 Tax=unclassified Rothia (in: high G+C Gram-positive bacteria) TaxID=2689056 RepID=UPI003AE1E404
MTPETQPGVRTSRRDLVRFATLTGVATVATAAAGGLAGQQAAQAADASSTVFPAEYIYPTVSGPSLAIWGSSSVEGAYADQGVPAGVKATLPELLSSYLSVPVLGFGRGGDTSSLITARRGVSANRYKLVFPDDMIPASGTVPVTLASDANVSWGSSTQVPGYVGDVPGLLLAGETENSLFFTRTVPGEEIYAPSDTAAAWLYSYQEMISRACYHVLQIGRNNLAETSRIQEDTQRAFDMAPTRSIVLGHFRAQKDSNTSDRAKQVETYNTWAAKTFGDRFMNPETFLRETTQESWLRYGALAGSGVWSSDKDRAAYKEGKIPPSFYATDGFHLNGWGYVAIAQQIYYRVTQLGWF